VQGSTSWRRTNPLTIETLALDAMWFNGTVGYALQRWLRVEGYESFSRQDTRLAAGQIHRHVFGVQMVVAQPVRIR